MLQVVAVDVAAEWSFLVVTVLAVTLVAEQSFLVADTLLVALVDQLTKLFSVKFTFQTVLKFRFLTLSHAHVRFLSSTLTT